MDQEYRKMGQEGLKIVFVQNKGKPVSFVKKITYSEIGLGACKIAWSLPAMLACYYGLCKQVSLPPYLEFVKSFTPERFQKNLY